MPLPFAPTPHQCWRAAQLFACGAAAASTVMLRQPEGKRQGLRIFTSMIAFFSAAFMTRFILQETESRLQMAMFAVAALMLERLRIAVTDDRFSLIRWALNAGAAICGVLLAKHILEPGAISVFAVRLADMLRRWSTP